MNKLCDFEEFVLKKNPGIRYIVQIYSKYDFEEAYRIHNVVMSYDWDDTIWCDIDWNEGETDCYVGKYIEVDDVFSSKHRR